MGFKNFWFPHNQEGRTYIIAEGGINAAGNLDCAAQMIRAAAACGCNAIKWQKRTPALAVPEAQKGVIRDTPDGKMTYLEYKELTEFSIQDCRQLFKIANDCRIDQSFSIWDVQSLIDITEFTDQIGWLKIPSCAITNVELCSEICDWARTFDKKVIASTGMSTLEEVDAFVRLAKSYLDPAQLILMHCNSSYPCKTSELNLNCIQTLKDRYNVEVGFSNHDMRVIPTIASIYKGATYIEVHFCLSREMWGTDISSSFEFSGLLNLTSGIRLLEQAEGDGVKRLYESELPSRQKLRL